MSVLATEHRSGGDDLLASRMAAMRAGEIGSVHSWETVTDAYGPGQRLVLRMAGCPLRCRHCHRPDAWRMRDGLLHTVDTVMSRIMREASGLKAGGGGVTISGGDPLMQPAFVAQVLRACREEGLHTALETSGYLGRRMTDAILDDLDLVLLDLKAGRPAAYREVTGRDQAPSLALVSRLAARGSAVWARYVVIPGLTDAPEEIEAVAATLAAVPGLERVEVIGFDHAGTHLWHATGRSHPLAALPAAAAAVTSGVRESLRAAGLPVA